MWQEAPPGHTFARCTHSRQDFVGFWRCVRDRNRNSENQHSLYAAPAPTPASAVAPVVVVVVVVVVAVAVVHINKYHSNAAQSRRSAFLSARQSVVPPLPASVHLPRAASALKFDFKYH